MVGKEIEKEIEKKAHGQNHRPPKGRGWGPVCRRGHPEKERKEKKPSCYRGRRIRK